VEKINSSDNEFDISLLLSFGNAFAVVLASEHQASPPGVSGLAFFAGGRQTISCISMYDA